MHNSPIHTPHQSPLRRILACVLGISLALFVAGCGQTASDSTSTATTEATEGTTQTDTTTTNASTDAATAPAAFDNNNIDYATVFPSWKADSKSLAEIVEFVKAVTDESSADYVPPEDRIATFDMDGTIICEKAPFYIDWCMLLNRVLDNPSYNEPEYKPSPEAVKQCQEIRDTINAGEKPTEEMEKNKARMIATEFAGLTQEQFREFAVNFAKSVDAVGFSGMTYGESWYKPMIEVINYLKANNFDVWMVSACEREFVRAIVPTVLDIPLDHIIGTDVSFEATKQGDEEYDKYNMEQGEDVLLGEELGQETAKAGKPIAIAREIGKQPIMAFGNSSGDYAMLNYAQSNPVYKGRGVLVLCDDYVREYGDEARATEQTQIANDEKWILIHMSDVDWATIYGEGVEKVALPGATAADEAKTEAADETAKDDAATETTDEAAAETTDAAATETADGETELQEAA